MVFPHGENTVPDTAAKGPEVAGVWLQGHLGKVIDDLIEALFEEGQDLALSAAVLVGGYHIYLRFFLQNSNHILDDFRPLL